MTASVSAMYDRHGAIQTRHKINTTKSAISADSGYYTCATNTIHTVTVDNTTQQLTLSDSHGEYTGEFE